jgi:holo-[acyl-carrier protein] synthase
MTSRLLPNDNTLHALVGVGRTRIGVDIVQISRVVDSLAQFGERFRRRLFTDHELACADEGATVDRLAARFAAKEAALKAFDLCEAGIDWREIEVRKLPNGACHLALHGKAAALAGAWARDAALSLTHDGDHALAVVAVTPSHS